MQCAFHFTAGQTVDAVVIAGGRIGLDLDDAQGSRENEESCE
jgi:hypothetical protein